VVGKLDLMRQVYAAQQRCGTPTCIPRWFCRLDPFEHTSTLSSTSTRWAVSVVLPFLRRWRAARILRQTLQYTNMAADVARMAGQYTVDLHAVGVPDAYATLDQLRQALHSTQRA